MRIGEESLPPRFGISDLPPDFGDVMLDTCDDAIPYFVMDRKEDVGKTYRRARGGKRTPKEARAGPRMGKTGKKGGWSALGESGGGSASPESGSRALTRRRVRCSRRPEKRAVDGAWMVFWLRWFGKNWRSSPGAPCGVEKTVAGKVAGGTDDRNERWPEREMVGLRDGQRDLAGMNDGLNKRHAWKLYQKRLCSCYLLLRGGGEGVAWKLLSGGMFTVNLHSGAMVGGVRPFPGKECGSGVGLVLCPFRVECAMLGFYKVSFGHGIAFLLKGERCGRIFWQGVKNLESSDKGCEKYSQNWATLFPPLRLTFQSGGKTVQGHVLAPNCLERILAAGLDQKVKFEEMLKQCTHHVASCVPIKERRGREGKAEKREWRWGNFDRSLVLMSVCMHCLDGSYQKSLRNGSFVWHLKYRQMRRKEQDRLARMDVDYQRRKEIAEFNMRQEERMKAAEERTAKKRLKRQKKKQKKKEKKIKLNAGGEEQQKEESSDDDGDSSENGEDIVK
ncbi:hypothetical protein CK203_032077 [Vitis vinifera]|uniref:Uncharacterized protein n=1 Tax=Vitis vinifera TaxID=29760 RepID=A0A438FN42_VITVI|nr:hypothetical protein CK203_032077 [Vitis vinifera]